VSRQLTVELAVNHDHFLKGYLSCGLRSNRLRLESASLARDLLTRNSCTYSPPIE
jgi:hypothetical protein